MVPSMSQRTAAGLLLITGSESIGGRRVLSLSDDRRPGGVETCKDGTGVTWRMPRGS
jgi:hypothetical protein